MSVQANSLTLFVVDISAPMGARREVEEQIVTNDFTTQTRKRTTTDLEWVCQFVTNRISEVILRGLKTTKVALITYGSSHSNNVYTGTPNEQDYLGIDHVFPPAVPTLNTLNLVQNLRAVSPSEQIEPGDPLSAIIDAIGLSELPERGGIRDSQKNSWKRSIYLITDGRAEFTRRGSDVLRDRLIAENIAFRVLGLDFDEQHGVKLEEKSEYSHIRQQNEAFWHEFVQGDHDFDLATASAAIENSRMPNLQVTKPSPSKMLLSFGDPQDMVEQHALQIPVHLYKMTDIVRPKKQDKISKLAYESAQAAQDGSRRAQAAKTKPDIDQTTTPLPPPPAEPYLTYKVGIKRDHFLLDQLASTQYSKEEPDPLSEEAASQFTRAWKLGASLIPVPDVAFETSTQTHKSMEILHFFSAATYRREYNMDQIWYVMADHGQAKAKMQLSTFVQAMLEMNVLALVRLIRRDGGESELGVLKPVVNPEFDYFYYSKVPFREDLRRFLFPPLDRIVTTEGVEVRSGPTIPDEADMDAMNAFVDSMELDEDWFSIADSYNPAVHGLKAAICHRYAHPTDQHLPALHPSLVKYLESPYEVRVRGARAAEKCREKFRIVYVPPKSSVDRKKRNFASAQLENSQQEAQQSKQGRSTTQAQVAAQKSMAPVPDSDDSATEDESEVRGSVPPKIETDSPPKPTLLDTSRPVAHLHELVQQEDVTQAVVQLEATIRHFVHHGTYDVALECMTAGKKVAQEYEEAMRWNLFIRSLKRTLLNAHMPFWKSSVKGHYEVGLVTEDEDEACQSDVTQQDAQEFIETEDL